MKSRLLSGCAFTPAPVGPTAPAKGAKPIPAIGTMRKDATPAQRKAKGAKPIPAIGTMRKDATPAQRKAFQKMKHQMKTAARNIRHDQHLREQEARDKP